MELFSNKLTKKQTGAKKIKQLNTNIQDVFTDFNKLFYKIQDYSVLHS